MSPNLADVEFFPGGVRTRAGLVSQFAALGGAVGVNGLKTYITSNLINRLLVFDSLGNLYKEATPGTLGLVATGGTPNLYLTSTTLFGREYMAFSDSLLGQDLRVNSTTHFLTASVKLGLGKGPLPLTLRQPETFPRACIRSALSLLVGKVSGLRRRHPQVGRRRAENK